MIVVLYTNSSVDWAARKSRLKKKGVEEDQLHKTKPWEILTDDVSSDDGFILLTISGLLVGRELGISKSVELGEDDGASLG